MSRDWQIRLLCATNFTATCSTFCCCCCYLFCSVLFFEFRAGRAPTLLKVQGVPELQIWAVNSLSLTMSTVTLQSGLARSWPRACYWFQPQNITTWQGHCYIVAMSGIRGSDQSELVMTLPVSKLIGQSQLWLLSSWQDRGRTVRGCSRGRPTSHDIT